MKQRQGPFHRAAMLGAFAAILAVALGVPGIAFAANTAVFSSAKPAPGSGTTVSKPMLSVIVYDRYGVSGAGTYRMMFGGIRVPVKLTRISGWGLRKFKLSYQVPTALTTLGNHRVKVSVTDLRGLYSSYQWDFILTDGIAPVTTSNAVTNYTGSATINLSATDNVAVANTFYRLDSGAQVSGTVISVSEIGPHLVRYWSVDAAGNVEDANWRVFSIAAPAGMDASHVLPAISCTVAGCHADNDVATVHLDKGCAMCHGTGITPTTNCITCHGSAPAKHSAGTHPAIVSTGDPSCSQTGCHGTAVVTIHSGDCALCHDSSNAAVLAAVASGTASCESCHAQDFDTIHGVTTAVHAVTGAACFNSSCHPSNAADIHTAWATPAGCVACHAPGVTPSLVCAKCHDNISTVHDFAHANPAGTESSACTSCHGTDLPAVHGPVGCVCHTATYLVGEMTPLLEAGTAECVDCHKGDYAGHGFDQTASGHSTSTYGYRGMREFFDGSDDGVVVNDTRNEPIEGEWAIPTARVFWTPGATNTPEGAFLGTDGQGLTAQSEITCRDCHSGIPLETGDPHGAQTIAAAGIDPDYPVPYKNAVLSHYQTNVQTFSDGTTATLMPAKSGINYRTSWETTSVAELRIGDDEVICAKCHDLWEENAAGTASADASAAAFFGFGNFAHEEHSRFNASGRGDCVNCHVAIPHGWNRPRLLIQTYSGVATQTTSGGILTTVAVVADPYPYSAPRGYWAAGRADNGFASFFPGMESKRMGLALIPAVWGASADTTRGYVPFGPGDHPAVEIPQIGEMQSSFMAPEWQERSSDCMAGCGGSLTRHPKTTQGSFVK